MVRLGNWELIAALLHTSLFYHPEPFAEFYPERGERPDKLASIAEAPRNLFRGVKERARSKDQREGFILPLPGPVVAR
jgi:hypothetical protein